MDPHKTLRLINFKRVHYIKILCLSTLLQIMCLLQLSVRLLSCAIVLLDRIRK